MFNKDFYPTPSSVFYMLVEGINAYSLNGNSILEPSAGKGDLVKQIERYVSSIRNISIYMMENDLELRNILLGLETTATFIGSDFLEDDCYYKPDLIIMNPPFSNGDAHLLRAWDLVNGNGTIRCVLNAQTYDNQCTAKRKLLGSLIDEFGGVTHRGSWFKDAERKTDVECIIVTLTKPKETDDLDLDLSKLKKEGIKELLEDKNNELALKDSLGNKELFYKEAIKQFEECTKAYSRCVKAMNGVIISEYGKPKLEDYLGKGQSGYNAFIKCFNKNSWEGLMNESDFKHLLTAQVQKQFTESFSKQSALMFTKNNMMEMFSTLYANAGNILDSCILEVFDHFTKYHKENRVHVEGWKTNDVYKVNKKVIIPLSFSWSGLDWDCKNKLNDVDRALGYMVGKKVGDFVTVADELQRLIKAKANGTWGFSEFFKVKYHLKGTAHLEFRDILLWERFNCAASQLRGYPLPEATEVERRYKNSQKGLA